MLRALLLILGLCISSTSAAAAPVSRDDPESADPGQAAISTAAGDAVVVTANPRASRAAAGGFTQVLKWSSGCTTWRRGRGRIFYFRPGHETFPIYKRAKIQKVLVNGVRWATFRGNTEAWGIGDAINVKEPLEPGVGSI